LARAVVDWIEQTMGKENGIHDHYWPDIAHPPELTDEEQKYMMGLTPRLKEIIMRNNLEYHVADSFYVAANPDHIIVGGHIEDAVMGPFYYGYGGPGEAQDRKVVNSFLEEEMFKRGPDTVLVHLKAPLEVITKRMRREPHPHSVLQEKDIEVLLGRFEEEVEASRIRQKIAIDTGCNTVKETLGELIEKMEPHFSDVDKQRILVHKLRQRGEWL